ncbi:hypothetical protein [Empedobacter brevis]|nr:hypothetical protein AS589_10230 [Empedobacter brevis]
MKNLFFTVLTLNSMYVFGQGQTINTDLGDHGPSTITTPPPRQQGIQESFGGNIKLSCNSLNRSFTYNINATNVIEGYIEIYPINNINYNTNEYENPVYEGYIYTGNILTSTYNSWSWDHESTTPKPYRVFVDASFHKQDGSYYQESANILCRF